MQQRAMAATAARHFGVFERGRRHRDRPWGNMRPGMAYACEKESGPEWGEGDRKKMKVGITI